MNLGKSAILATVAITLVTSAGSAAASGSGPLPFTLQKNGPQDLGTLGGNFSQANAVDALTAAVAGTSTTEGEVAYHAVTWNAKTKKIQDLGVLSGGVNSFGAGVTLDGTATGASEYDDPILGIVQRAFISKGSTISQLGTLGGSQSQGTAINEFHEVVGYSFTTGDAATHAFAYNPKTAALEDLGTLGGTNSSAFAVDDLGLAGGSSETGQFDANGNAITHAAAWDTIKNKIYDLGTLGGNYAQVNGVSNLGMAAGFSALASGKTDAFAYMNGKLVDLGTLGGSTSEGLGINDFGVVVGFSNTTGDATVHAFLWTARSGIVDLNSLLPQGSPWTLTEASGINDENRIVGYGLINGEYHAFIW